MLPYTLGLPECPHCHAIAVTRVHRGPACILDVCDRCGYMHLHGQDPVQYQAVLSLSEPYRKSPEHVFVPEGEDLDEWADAAQFRPGVQHITLRRAPEYRTEVLRGRPTPGRGEMPEAIWTYLTGLFAGVGEAPHALAGRALYVRSRDPEVKGYRVLDAAPDGYGAWEVRATRESHVVIGCGPEGVWVDPEVQLRELLATV